MKITFLYNKIKTDREDISNSHWYGMPEMRSLGADVSFVEIEQYFPSFLCKFLRKIISIHWIHLLVFPKILISDVVITSTAYGISFIRALLGLNKPCWIIIDFNLAREFSIRKGLKLFALKKTVDFVDGIIAISEEEKKNMENLFPRKLIKFIRFGIDEEEFKPSSVEPGDFVLSVGRDPGRDYKTLIEAVRGTNIKLIVTAKPSQLGDVMPLPQNVLIKDFSKEELMDAYNKAKCIVLPLSPRDNSADSMGCSSLLEAMSMGKAVIVTDTLHMHSYIENEKTAIFVPKGDAESMRKELLRLTSDSVLASDLGKNARIWIEKNATMFSFAKELKNFIEDEVLSDIVSRKNQSYT